MCYLSEWYILEMLKRVPQLNVFDEENKTETDGYNTGGVVHAHASVPLTVFLSGSPKRVHLFKAVYGGDLRFNIIDYDFAEFTYSDSSSQLVDQIISAYSTVHLGDLFSTHDRIVAILKEKLRETGKIPSFSATNFELHGCRTCATAIVE